MPLQRGQPFGGRGRRALWQLHWRERRAPPALGGISTATAPLGLGLQLAGETPVPLDAGRNCALFFARRFDSMLA
jgi:hypothetical protein